MDSNMMYILYPELYGCIVGFLETQEYMSFLKVSKVIHKNICHMNDERKPYISAYDSNYGGVEISEVCRKLRNKLEFENDGNNIFDKYRSGPLVRAILELGSKKSSSQYSRITLCAVPYKFKNCVVYGYNGIKTPYGDTNLYMRQLIRQQRTMLDEIEDPVRRLELQNIYFRNLLCEEKKVTEYDKKGDRYMNIYNRRLEKLIENNHNIHDQVM
jgi:hypothetical protein